MVIPFLAKEKKRSRVPLFELWIDDNMRQGICSAFLFAFLGHFE